MQLDHINIKAVDQEAMRDFLVTVLDLEVGFRPPFDFPGYWLYLGDNAIIHLKEREPASDASGWVDHIAFGPFDFDEQCNRLDKASLKYGVGGIPGTGIRQIFVAGPEGAKIELQCPQNEA